MFKDFKGKNSLVKIFIILFLFTQIFSLFLLARPAYAQGPASAVVIAKDVPATTKWGWEKMGKAMLNAALGSVLHAASYFIRKMAYDSALWIAHGGKGQGALAFKDGGAAYFTKLGEDTAADAINQLGKPFGLNLCSTPDLQLQAFLQIGMHSLYWGKGGPTPSCTWQKMSDSWSAEAFEQKYGPGGSKWLTQNFSNALRFEDSDFGIAVGAKSKIDRQIASVLAGANLDRLEGSGYKAVTNLISGKITAPSDLVEKESAAITKKTGQELSLNQMGSVYATGALQVIPMAASVFLNTLTSEGFKVLQTKFLELFEDGDSESFEGITSFSSAGFKASRKKAEAVLSDLLAVTIRQINNYTLLDEFASCPMSGVKPGLNNCVMDGGLRQAIEQSRLGEPITIQEAIDKGYLDGGWILSSPKRKTDNFDMGCYLKAFCYSNVQKLRRARILPLGFEIAVSIADPDRPEITGWTLQDVVDGFYDCPEPNQKGIIIPDYTDYPYCHLIDPNWILKLPETRCNASVYSDNLLDENQTGSRAQECVDAQSCIKENDDGTCKFYGYCTREKSVWRFNADMCEEQYNTCTTYTSSAGEINSYLSKTVDYGECTYDSVGCRAYSTEKTSATEQNPEGLWLTSIEAKGAYYKELGRNQTLYFNQKVESCFDGSSADGCSQFYLASEFGDSYDNNYSDSIYLRKAPDYLGCYDINLNTPEIDWPVVKPDLLKIKDRPAQCAGFSQVCLPEEVGCDAYTPLVPAKSATSYLSASPTTLANSIEIPGIIGEDNYCDASCAGYETFRQQATAFEPTEFPLYFIPNEANQCSYDFAGCDEFTNIDELSRGGEGLEYYSDLKYCERPTADNEKIYYSWEGSKDEGYVLKLHKLRPIKSTEYDYLVGLVNFLNLGDQTVEDVFSAGSPAYASEEVDTLNSHFKYCNQEKYNNLINNNPGMKADSDCRALYDREGKVFYRILAHTITVSDQCHPLRKTNSNLYVDESIDESMGGEVFCVEQKKGVWEKIPGSDSENEFCQRCYAGGSYEKGTCIYWAISGSGESKACPAYANGCRGYTGNTAYNMKQVFFKDFNVFGEDETAINQAKSGWFPDGGVKISSESIIVGSQSLQVVDNNVYYEIDASDLAGYDTFELSFWARGNNQQISIYLENEDAVNLGYFTFDKITNTNTELSLSPSWKLYQLGPTTINGLLTNKVKLVFASDMIAGETYFLDNLQLNGVAETYYVIKDSWKKDYQGDGVLRDVPLICDANSDDPFPGSALGCRQYKEESTERTDIYATGFDTMCRENAVGCKPMYDTFNSSQKNLTAHNVWCEDNESGGEDKKCELTMTVDSEPEVLGYCYVQPGETGCFVDSINTDDKNIISNIETEITNADVVSSTIIIPADTVKTEPVFLTNRQAFRCAEKNQGCQKTGLEEQVLPDKNSTSSYKFKDDVYILNQPDKYDVILCRADLVGCEEFTAKNEKTFFKDPQLTGNSFCEYKEKVLKDNSLSYSGWFVKDFGVCGSTKQLCQSDNDCAEEVVCGQKGKVPCYDNYILPGGAYGIWPNGSENYKSMVGLCSSRDNGCTELVDPQDTSDLHPEGQPYYVIFNDRLTSRAGECGGQVSLKEGCVLFNNTNKPNLLYNAESTYKKSKELDYILVDLISTEPRDSNELLKVTRDRECNEWLACQGAKDVEDPQSEAGQKKVCYAIQPCDDGGSFGCTHVASAEEKFKDKILDQGVYINRDVSWQQGREFSGYSLFNQYQIRDLDSIIIDADDIKNGTTTTTEDQTVIGFVNDNLSIQNGCSTKSDFEECGASYNKGVCYDGRCIYPATGKYKDLKSTENNMFFDKLYNQICRGFPEIDSPYYDEDNTIVESWSGIYPNYVNTAFENTKICLLGENCYCDYLRVGFGSQGQVDKEVFLGLDGKLGYPTLSDIAEGDQGIDINELKLIQGGDNDGEFCDESNFSGIECDDSDGLSLLSPIRKSRRLGWHGYCLERDYSRHINGRKDETEDAYACLTWMPVDSVSSMFDIYNTDQSIGYVAPADTIGGKAYCSEMIGWQNMEVSKIGENGEYMIPCVLNVLSYVPGITVSSDFCYLYKWEYGEDDLDEKYMFFLDLVAKTDYEYGADKWKSDTGGGGDLIEHQRIYMKLKEIPLPMFQEFIWTLIDKTDDWSENKIVEHKDGLIDIPLDYDIDDSNTYYKYYMKETKTKDDNNDPITYYPQHFATKNPVELTNKNAYEPNDFFITRVDQGSVNPLLFYNYDDTHQDTLASLATDDYWSWRDKGSSDVDELGSERLWLFKAFNFIMPFMLSQGVGDEPSAPLFPDLEYYGSQLVNYWASSKTTKSEDWKEWSDFDADDTEWYDGPYEEYYDTGTIRHKANKLENFLTKDMIKSVSIVPLWVAEQGKKDIPRTAQIPAIAERLYLALDGNYSSISDDIKGEDLEKLPSTQNSMGNLNFGKYWILKSIRNDEFFGENELDGFILTWAAVDPFSDTETITLSDDEYSDFKFGGFDINLDPFALNIKEPETDSETEGNHLLALELLFDKETGQFKGYKSRNINTYGDETEWGYATAVIFELQPICLEAVEVVDDNNPIFNNKAQTERLWEQANYTAKFAHLEKNYNVKTSPFGSIMADNLDNSDSNWFNVYPDNEIDGQDHAGKPIQCQTKYEDNDNNLLFTSSCEQRISDVLLKKWTATYPDFDVLGIKNLDEACKFIPIISNNTSQGFCNFFNSAEESNVKYDIDQLFARVYKVRSKLDESNAKYFNPSWDVQEYSDGNNFTKYGYGDSAFELGTPPTIYFPTKDMNGTIDKYKNKFAVNGLMEAGDALYGQGSLPTQATFYAWADHNQMALRRIMVDWQDRGIGLQTPNISGNQYGYYKNTKPYCNGGLAENYECRNKTGNEYLGLTCDPAKNNSCPWGYECLNTNIENLGYGNQKDITCEENVNTAYWNYTCDIVQSDYAKYFDDTADATKGGLKDKPYVYKISDLEQLITDNAKLTTWQNILKEKGHTEDDLVCVYIPRVQVLDNWGWCSGTCSDGGKSGCYNGIFPDGIEEDHCHQKENTAWLPYSDIVIVAP